MHSNFCFFVGHRDTPNVIFSALLETVERHITEYGVTDFVVGNYGNFDALAGKAIKDAKKRHPTVTLTLLLPYRPFDRPTPIPPGFDGTFYPPGMERVPKRFAILRANRYIVDHSGYLIAYVRRPASNACALVEYAQTRRVQVENLCQVTCPNTPPK